MSSTFSEIMSQTNLRVDENGDEMVSLSAKRYKELIRAEEKLEQIKLFIEENEKCQM